MTATHPAPRAGRCRRSWSAPSTGFDFLGGYFRNNAATLFVTSLIPDARWAMAVLLVFGVATILGMMIVTMLLALPSAYAAARLGRLQQGVRVASGIASIGFGLWLAHRIGVHDGLFTATPHWTAH